MSDVPLNVNLLRDPVFDVRVGDDDHRATTIPGLLALLSGGKDITLEMVQAYQEHAVYSFLVNLALLAIHKSGSTLATEKEWAKAILQLGPEEAWDLLQKNLTLPAFLQAPTDSTVFKGDPLLTPDEADTIPSSANHSRKQRSIVAPSPQHWIYALISSAGNSVSIAGYRGTPRATSSGRVCVTIAPSYSWGARFLRDVEIGSKNRNEIIKSYKYDPENGIGLVWVELWDGKSTLASKCLDPFFIDQPQLVRLVERDGRIVAYSRETDAARVSVSGTGGDLFSPCVKTKEGFRGIGLGNSTSPVLSLTTGYENIHSLVFASDTIKSLSSRPVTGSGPGLLMVAGMVRDKGKTNGYYERAIPMSREVVDDVATADEESKVASCSKVMIEETQEITEVVSNAIYAVMLGKTKLSKSLRDRHSKEHSKLLAGFEAAVDEKFFDHLFKRAFAGNPIPWFEFTLAKARETIRLVSRTSVHHIGSYFAGLSAAEQLLDEYEKIQRKKEADTDMNNNQATGTFDTCHSVITRIHSRILALKHRGALGKIAQLRRLDPTAPDGSDYYEIEASTIDKSGLPRVSTFDREHGRRWATVVRATANVVGLHGNGPTGRALSAAGVKPARLERFLNSQGGDSLDGNFESLVRFLRQKKERFNLTDLAFVYLWPTSSEANDVRRKLAKSYYLTTRAS